MEMNPFDYSHAEFPHLDAARKEWREAGYKEAKVAAKISRMLVQLPKLQARLPKLKDAEKKAWEKVGQAEREYPEELKASDAYTMRLIEENGRRLRREIA